MTDMIKTCTIRGQNTTKIRIAVHLSMYVHDLDKFCANEEVNGQNRIIDRQ